MLINASFSLQSVSFRERSHCSDERSLDSCIFGNPASWISMHKLLNEIEGPRPAEEGRAAAGPAYVAAYCPSPPKIEGDPQNLYDCFRTAVAKFQNRPALGWRPVVGGRAQEYTFMTYAEMDRLVTSVGSALGALGVEPNSAVGIYASNCPEWMIAMKAADRMGAQCVPLYDTFGKDAVQFIIGHSEAKVVFCSGVKLKELSPALANVKSHLLQVIVWGDAPAEVLEEAKQAGVPITMWDKFVAFGSSEPKPATPGTPESICTIMYTSGTTGEPKGVRITNRAVMGTVAALMEVIRYFNTPVGEEDVFYSYLPLAHIFGRVAEEAFLVKGGSIGYWQADPRKIMDDIAALRPTIFVGVPRIFDRVYSGVLAQVAKSWVTKMVFDAAFTVKRTLMAMGWKTFPVLDTAIFGPVQKRLGGRVRIIVSGGAPLADHVEEFLKITMCCRVAQGYGLTESCGASLISNPNFLEENHTVGIPVGGLQLRLQAVPEMGYDPLAKPPRGEVCIRGPVMFEGYHKRDELTSEAVDADGWFHTGDVGELTESGALKLIDRVKNFFKLAHGEYVAAERVENVLKRVTLVDQVWVHGDSKKSQLVAVVVPDHAALKAWASGEGLSDDVKALCADPKTAAHVQSELEKSGRADGLKGFEVAKRVHLDPEAWSTENDLMTPSFKLKRPNLKKRYQKEIDAMYAALGE